ncbi:DUF2017 domain-containing protein [Cellulomonas soli]|uniref:DUF2017 domain-containing protein n=1 Tax=Cellulomonas soli TaxID=931535 RepID=UPI003F8550E2
MRAFERLDGRTAPDGSRPGYVAQVDATERALLSVLTADVAELLGVDRGDDGLPAWPASREHEGPHLRVRTGPVEPPRDGAVRRLLPDASRDDPEVSAEFRRLTEDDLRAGKVARLATLWELVTSPGPDTDQLLVPAECAQDVAATLTDVRLVLAERLDVRTDEEADALYDVLDLPDLPEGTDDRDGLDDELDEELAVRRYLVSVYGALGLLQESLVELMLEDLRRGSHQRPGRGGTATG